jgi:hypothetical protein
VTQSLYGRKHIRRLVDIGLPDRYGPIRVIDHVIQHGWVVADRFYAYIPILVVYPGAAAPSGQVHVGIIQLIRVGSRRKHLREQGIRIERDWSKQLVHFVVGIIVCLRPDGQTGRSDQND